MPSWILVKSPLLPCHCHATRLLLLRLLSLLLRCVRLNRRSLRLEGLLSLTSAVIFSLKTLLNEPLASFSFPFSVDAYKFSLWHLKISANRWSPAYWLGSCGQQPKMRLLVDEGCTSAAQKRSLPHRSTAYSFLRRESIQNPHNCPSAAATTWFFRQKLEQTSPE